MAGRDYSSLLSLKSKIRPRFFQLLHTVQRISEKKKKKDFTDVDRRRMFMQIRISIR